MKRNAHLGPRPFDRFPQRIVWHGGGERPARDAIRIVISVLLLATLGGCKRDSAEGEVDVDAPALSSTAIARSDAPGQVATSLAMPEALPTLVVEPFEGGPPPAMNIVPAQEAGARAYPLDWSPDGASLTALLPTGRNDLQGRAMGRLVVLNETGALIWDSGDIETPIGGPAPGAWFADGTLVLARRDGTFTRSDGSQASAAQGLEGQPREVWVDPRRQRALLLGPGTAFIVSPGQAALRLDEWPSATDPSEAPPGFAWSPDGSRIALSAADGRHLLFDATSGAAALLLQDGASPWAAEAPVASWPSPSWLADGRLLLGSETRRRYSDGDLFDHRLMNTTSARASELGPEFGIEASEQRSDALASPDGRFILRAALSASRPGVETEAGGADVDSRSQGAINGHAWLIEILTGSARMIPEPGDPLWSPKSKRWLRMDAAGIALITRFDESGDLVQTAIPLDPSASLHAAAWSPDDRWIVLLLEDGSLVLVDATGERSPIALGTLAPGMVGSEGLQAAWSPDGRRLALRANRPDRGDSDSPTADSVRLFMLNLAP